MRITILTQYYWPQPLANAEVIAPLAEALARRGHEVTVITPAAGSRSSDAVGVVRTLGWFAPDRSSIPLRLVEYAAFTVGGLGGLLRRRATDVVIVPSPPPTLGFVGLALAARNRSRMIYNAQDLYPEIAEAVSGTPGPMIRLVRPAMRWLFRRSAAVVVIDPAFVRTIETAEPAAVVRWVRNGIDLAPFVGAVRDEAYLRSIGATPDAPVVMYAGNVGRSQDLRTAVLATELAGTQLVIHGGGAGLEDLRAWIGASGFRHVSFSPYGDRAHLGRVFASADLHLVPLKASVARSSLPSKMLSIAAAGRPALLCAEEGTPAASVLEESGGGWRIPTGTGPGSVAEAIGRALSDLEELERRGRAARKWALENAGTDAAAAAWEEVLDDVLR